MEEAVEVFVEVDVRVGVDVVVAARGGEAIEPVDTRFR